MNRKLVGFNNVHNQAGINTNLLNRPTVLAVLPSMGLGGGIERYANWLLDVLKKNGSTVVSVPMLTAGEKPIFTNKLRFMFRLVKTIHDLKSTDGCIAIVFHPNLASLSLLIFKVTKIKVLRSYIVFYGQDIWNSTYFIKLLIHKFKAVMLTRLKRLYLGDFKN